MNTAGRNVRKRFEACESSLFQRAPLCNAQQFLFPLKKCGATGVESAYLTREPLSTDKFVRPRFAHWKFDRYRLTTALDRHVITRYDCSELNTQLHPALLCDLHAKALQDLLSTVLLVPDGD